MHSVLASLARHDRAIEEAVAAAVTALDIGGVPLPPPGPDLVEFMDRLRASIETLVDRLPLGGD